MNTALPPLCHPPTTSTDLYPALSPVCKYRAPLCTFSTALVPDIPRAQSPREDHTRSSPLPRGRVVSWAQASKVKLGLFGVWPGTTWARTSGRRSRSAPPWPQPSWGRKQNMFKEFLPTQIYTFSKIQHEHINTNMTEAVFQIGGNQRDMTDETWISEKTPAQKSGKTREIHFRVQD